MSEIKRPGWYPPAGAVVIQPGPAISCKACETVTPAGTPGNAIRMRDRHRCPAGTPAAHPRCPDCSSIGPHCLLVDGQPAPVWHPSRTDLYAAAVRAR